MPSLAERVLAKYRKEVARVGETVQIRRWSGTGPTRTHVDTDTTARIIGYAPRELVGSIVQGDRKAIVLVDTLSSVLPILTTGNDKLVVRGKELAILAVDDSTRRIGGTLIALELQVRG